MSNKATFYDATSCAIFCAELMRQGIAFTVHDMCNGAFEVRMTGY